MEKLQFHYYFENQEDSFVGETFHLIVKENSCQVSWCELFNSSNRSIEVDNAVDEIGKVEIHQHEMPSPHVPKISCENLEYLENPSHWTNYIVAVIQANSNPYLKQQLELCNHYGVHMIVVKEYASNITNLYQLASALKQTDSNRYVCLRCRVEESDEDWLAWNKFRMLIKQNTCTQSLRLVLEFSEDVPEEETLILRWISEPLHAVSIGIKSFMNSHGLTILPMRHSEVLSQILEVTSPSIIIRNDNQFESLEVFLQEYQGYAEAIQYIYAGLGEKSELETTLSNFANVLQLPLQPQSSHLSSFTYEIFEKDNTKYQQYQIAIQLAMEDILKRGRKSIVIMIVGGGRGPLVDVSIQAAASLQIESQVQFFIVEKNPYCFQLLDLYCKEKWTNVSLVKGDMRKWHPETKADIMVSELLGSFGDNELSPECIYSSMHLLKSDGICIPQSYTSYISPVSSIDVHENVHRIKGSNNFEKSYVVHMTNTFRIDEPQPVFTFEHLTNTHSNPEVTIQANSICRSIEELKDMHAKLHFHSSENCCMTGFAGYFNCVLYESVTLSICPSNITPGLFSWFPMYFPIKVPITVLKGERVHINFSRLCNNRCVWYEWDVSTDSIQSEIHNCAAHAFQMDKY